MLNSLEIENFRIFKKIQFDGLSRVNLFLGKNNVGKSSVLEGIKLYSSNGDPDILMNLILSREGTWEHESPRSKTSVFANALRHLFFNHELPIDQNKGIKIGEIGNSANKLSLRVEPYKIEISEEGSRKMWLRQGELFDEDVYDDIGYSLVTGAIGKPTPIIDLDEDLASYFRRPIRLKKKRKDAGIPVRVVETQEISNEEIAYLWDAISLTDLSEEVIKGLQLIDPNIKDVAFVQVPLSEYYRDRYPNRRIAMVKHAKYNNEPLPLKSMGDGLSRLFHIVLALVNARDGYLLVDEFENGLHWQVQSKVWDIVFRLSSELNVQVFATTHSRDCIEGFEKCWEVHGRKAGCLYRLDQREEGILPTRYTLETLSDSIDTKVEIR